MFPYPWVESCEFGMIFFVDVNRDGNILSGPIECFSMKHLCNKAPFFVPIPDSFNIFIIYWDLQGRWTCVRVCVCVCAWVCVCVFACWKLELIGLGWSNVSCLSNYAYDVVKYIILTAFKFCGSLGRLCTWLVNFLRRGLSGRPFLLPLWCLQALHVCGVLEIVDSNLRLHHWSAWKNIHELLHSHFTATAKWGLQQWWAIASACMQSRL